jgi:hypothetical protein
LQICCRSGIGRAIRIETAYNKKTGSRFCIDENPILKFENAGAIYAVFIEDIRAAFRAPALKWYICFTLQGNNNL